MPVAEVEAPVKLQTKRPARPTSTRTKRKDIREPLNIRIRPELRGLIDHAAEITGKNRTDFILDAARRAAEDAVLDRTLIVLSPEAYDSFVALLDEPPQPNHNLIKTMQTRAPWE